MTQDLELLNFIYQNAEMGKKTIPQLTKVVEEPAFRKVLEDELAEYQTIFNAAQEKINAAHQEAKGIGAFEKITAYGMTNLNTMLDRSHSHIAEMMLQGSNMGIIDITKKLKQYPDADAQTVKLANRLLKLEQNNLDELKSFL